MVLMVVINKNKIMKALITFDKEEKLYTISNIDNKFGGAVISNKDLDIAKTTFEEALSVSRQVAKLLRFSNSGKWNRELMAMDKKEIEYINSSI